jgi:hypothetical protein
MYFMMAVLSLCRGGEKRRGIFVVVKAGSKKWGMRVGVVEC